LTELLNGVQFEWKTVLELKCREEPQLLRLSLIRHKYGVRDEETEETIMRTLALEVEMTSLHHLHAEEVTHALE
jgi:hypothetical protein